MNAPSVDAGFAELPLVSVDALLAAATGSVGPLSGPAGSNPYTENLSETTSCQSIGSSIKIAPGSKRAGCLTFEIPKTAKPAVFQFTLDSGFADVTGEWQL